MLRLTRKADYGLRLMVEVAASASDAVTTMEVARRQEIPYEFLRKVAQTLACRGLLESDRGFRGGFRLALPADEITVLDIITAFDPPYLNCCTVDPPQCERRNTCAVYPVWAEAQKEVERVLGGARLSSLISQHAMLNQARKRKRTATATVGAER